MIIKAEVLQGNEPYGDLSIDIILDGPTGLPGEGEKLTAILSANQIMDAAGEVGKENPELLQAIYK